MKKITGAFVALLATATMAARSESEPVKPAPYVAELASARSLIMESPIKAYGHAQIALSLLARNPSDPNAPMERATATWLSGEAMTQMGRPVQGLPLLEQAFREASHLAQNSILVGDILMSRGRAEAAAGSYQAALQNFQAAFSTFGAHNDRRGQAKALLEIGSIYLQARDYAHALGYYNSARDMAINDGYLSIAAENNRGSALEGLGRFADAEHAYQHAFSGASRLHSYRLAAHISENLAFTALKQGKSSEALGDIAQGLDISAQHNEAKAEQPFLLAEEANVYDNAKDYKTAARLTDKAFAGSSNLATTQEWRDAHQIAASVFDHLHQSDKALMHYKAFKQFDDQGATLAASTEAALMSAKFDFASQKERIAQLQAENLKRDVQLAKSQTRSTLLIAAILCLAGLLLIGLLTHSLLSMRKNRKKISAVNDELAKTNHALEKALNARTEFLAMTSHEIRTPLNGILGMTQVMLAEPSTTGELRNRLEIIKASGVTMNGMLTDLLDIAKIEKGHMVVEQSEIDLCALVREVAQMWSDQASLKGLQFQLDLSGSPVRVIQDPSILRQVLTNLLSNAIKFTSRGHVKLSVNTSGGLTEERLVLTVEDSGIGIPAEQSDRVFEAFTQVDGGTSRHYGGTGLGLAICKSLVEMLGGGICLTSQVGAGTIFTVDLPLVRPQAQLGGSEPLGDFNRASILAVEDNPLAQAMLRSVLKDRVGFLDFSVNMRGIAQNTVAAIDVVIVDGACVQRQAPADPDGFLTQLRQALPDKPLVLLWPLLTAEDADRLKSLGMDRVLPKPATSQMLIAALEEVYRQPATASLDDRDARIEFPRWRSGAA